MRMKMYVTWLTSANRSFRFDMSDKGSYRRPKLLIIFYLVVWLFIMGRLIYMGGNARITLTAAAAMSTYMMFSIIRK